MNSAIIHDWFVNYAGSEKCVESFTSLLGDADIFSLVDFLNNEQREKILKGKHAEVSFIQKLPFAKKNHRVYFPLFPLAIEQFDLSEYDLILSSSHAFAKGVLTHAGQLHISYCHTPVRYAWDLYHQYLKEAGLTSGVKASFTKYAMHKIRMWDYSTANRVDFFIANSGHIARRIKKIYGKEADVIYPPVDTQDFILKEEKKDYYLTASRLVPYKKIDLIARAFKNMPDKKLVIIGGGPQKDKIKQLNAPNITLLGHQPYDKLIEYMRNAKAFLFAAEEDFGITIVEAQACGTPVIAFKTGGASETVLPGKTGILFDKQNEASIEFAVGEFEKAPEKFESEFISEHAQKFSRARFEREIEEYINSKYDKFRQGL